MAKSLKELINTVGQAGRVEWIGLRLTRREPMQAVDTVTVDESGLVGDHGRPGKRAVTLIQQEHLTAIGSCIGKETADPADLRRNIVVSGINLLALKGRTIEIGSARLFVTGPCAPCSRMEEALGPGGYSAMRGHGGITASVVSPGTVAIGDSVVPIDESAIQQLG